MIFNRHRELMSGGADPQISLSKSAINVDAHSGTATVSLTSNTDWTLSSNGDWCTLSATSGKKGTFTITITYSQYTDSGTDRSCVLVAETKRRGVRAVCTVTQAKDYITSTTYTIGNISAGTTTLTAAGGNSTISGGAGSVVYTWKSGKANTTGTFIPVQSIARTSGSSAGSASISNGTVTVNSLTNNYYNGNTVFTVTYSYNPPTPSTGTVSGPASKTCTITQTKNVCTIQMGTVNGGSMTSSNSYNAGSESKTFSSNSAASLSGVTIKFTSGTNKTDYNNYGTLSGPTYNWSSSQSYFTLTSSNVTSLSVSSTSRGTDYSESTRSATITRTATYGYTLSSSYGGGSTTTSGSCTGTATQAANMLTVTSAAVNAGSVTSSLSFGAGKETKTISNSSTASTGNVTLTFDSGATAGTPTNYGSWNNISYSWSSSNTGIITLTSSNASSLSVSSVNRGTTLGDVRSATVTRTATATFTLNSAYDGKSGSAISKSASASTNCACAQAANTVTYGLPQFKGLGYNKLIDASGGTANITGNNNYVQLATYTSDTGTIEITSGATFSYQRAEAGPNNKGLDPEMFISQNDIWYYDNNNSGKTTISRVSSGIPTGCSNNSGYALKITNTGVGATPGLGGWYFAMWGSAGQTYICTFNAWIPTGYTIEFASNSTGDGATRAWQTPNIGTGSWRTYSFLVTYGTTGDISSTFFFYLTGTAGSTANPLVWYINNVYLAKVSNVSASTPTINTSTGAVTLGTKGTAASDINIINMGAVKMTISMNGKSSECVLYPEQAKNEIVNTNYNPSDYTANITIGSGIGPGTGGSTGTSATVSYSANHKAYDQYTSTSYNNQHTVNDTATVTKVTDTNSKYTLSGTTSASGSGSCTLSLGNMTSNVATYSCTLRCTNGSHTSTTKDATVSATNAIASYTSYAISGSKSTSSNVPVGGSSSYYATITCTRKPVYSSGYTGSSTGAPFKISSITNTTLWSASGGSGTQYTTSTSSINSGTKLYINAGTNYNTLNTRDVKYTVCAVDNTSTTAEIKWTQTADTSSVKCYTYDYSGTAWDNNNNLDCAASQNRYFTVSIVRTAVMQYTNGKGTYNGTVDNGGTVNLSGTNCTCVNSSGSTITTAKHGDKVYIKTTSNGVTSGSSAATRNVSVTLSYSGCDSYSKTMSKTQNADTSSHKCYTYSISWTRNSTANIPVAGGNKNKNAKLSLTRNDIYKWSVGGGEYTKTTDHTGSVTLSGTNCTVVNSSGTTITSLSNDSSAYINVGSWAGNGSTRSVSINASITSDCGVQYTGSATWTQTADTSSHDHYEYSIGFTDSGSGNIACGGISSIGRYATLSVVRSDIYKWSSAGTTYVKSTDNTGTISLTGTNCTLKNASNSTISTATNGTKIYMIVSSNGGASGSCSSNTRSVSIKGSITNDKSTSYSNTISWTQDADTKTFNCYRYVLGLLPSSTSNIDKSGTSKSIYATVSITRYHVYKWNTSGNTAECANDTNGTVSLSGTNLTCTNASGGTITTATNGTKVYISVGTNYQTTSTRKVTITASSTDGCTTYNTSCAWTQNADSYTSKYQYTVTWTKGGSYASSNIPAAGTNKAAYATCNISRLEKRTWASGGTTNGSTDSGGSVTVSCSNGTCTNSSGTTITSASNGTKVYISVAGNGKNSNNRTVTVSCSNGTSAYSSNTYNSVSWTQDADTYYTLYNYAVTWTDKTSGTIPITGVTSNTYKAKCNISRTPVRVWTVGGRENMTTDTGGGLNLTSTSGSGVTYHNTSGSSISSVSNGQYVVIHVSSNAHNSNTRTCTISGTAQDSLYNGGSESSIASCSWTQEADYYISNNNEDKYNVTWTKGTNLSNGNPIPVGGANTNLNSYDDTWSAVCNIDRYRYQRWYSDNAAVGYSSVSHEGTVSISATNSILQPNGMMKRSGSKLVAATTASNGDRIYFNVRSHYNSCVEDTVGMNVSMTNSHNASVSSISGISNINCTPDQWKVYEYDSYMAIDSDDFDVYETSVACTYTGEIARCTPDFSKIPSSIIWKNSGNWPIATATILYDYSNDNVSYRDPIYNDTLPLDNTYNGGSVNVGQWYPMTVQVKTNLSWIKLENKTTGASTSGAGSVNISGESTQTLSVSIISANKHNVYSRSVEFDDGNIIWFTIVDNDIRGEDKRDIDGWQCIQAADSQSVTGTRVEITSVKVGNTNISDYTAPCLSTTVNATINATVYDTVTWDSDGSSSEIISTSSNFRIKASYISDSELINPPTDVTKSCFLVKSGNNWSGTFSFDTVSNAHNTVTHIPQIKITNTSDVLVGTYDFNQETDELVPDDVHKLIATGCIKLKQSNGIIVRQSRYFAIPIENIDKTMASAELIDKLILEYATDADFTEGTYVALTDILEPTWKATSRVYNEPNVNGYILGDRDKYTTRYYIGKMYKWLSDNTYCLYEDLADAVSIFDTGDPFTPEKVFSNNCFEVMDWTDPDNDGVYITAEDFDNITYLDPGDFDSDNPEHGWYNMIWQKLDKSNNPIFNYEPQYGLSMGDGAAGITNLNIELDYGPSYGSYYLRWGSQKADFFINIRSFCRETAGLGHDGDRTDGTVNGLYEKYNRDSGGSYYIATPHGIENDYFALWLYDWNGTSDLQADEYIPVNITWPSSNISKIYDYVSIGSTYTSVYLDDIRADKNCNETYWTGYGGTDSAINVYKYSLGALVSPTTTTVAPSSSGDHYIVLASRYTSSIQQAGGKYCVVWCQPNPAAVRVHNAFYNVDCYLKLEGYSDITVTKIAPTTSTTYLSYSTGTSVEYAEKIAASYVEAKTLTIYKGPISSTSATTQISNIPVYVAFFDIPANSGSTNKNWKMNFTYTYSAEHDANTMNARGHVRINIPSKYTSTGAAVSSVGTGGLRETTNRWSNMPATTKDMYGWTNSAFPQQGQSGLQMTLDFRFDTYDYMYCDETIVAPITVNNYMSSYGGSYDALRACVYNSSGTLLNTYSDGQVMTVPQNAKIRINKVTAGSKPPTTYSSSSAYWYLMYTAGVSNSSPVSPNYAVNIVTWEDYLRADTTGYSSGYDTVVAGSRYSDVNAITGTKRYVVHFGSFATSSISATYFSGSGWSGNRWGKAPAGTGYRNNMLSILQGCITITNHTTNPHAFYDNGNNTYSYDIEDYGWTSLDYTDNNVTEYIYVSNDKAPFNINDYTWTYSVQPSSLVTNVGLSDTIYSKNCNLYLSDARSISFKQLNLTMRLRASSGYKYRYCTMYLYNKYARVNNSIDNSSSWSIDARKMKVSNSSSYNGTTLSTGRHGVHIMMRYYSYNEGS